MVQSLSSVPAYRQFYSLYLQSNYNMSFMAWCDLKGYSSVLYQEIENYLETGDPYHGKNEVDTINVNRHIANGNKVMFQSEDAETYYEFDWSSGKISTFSRQEAQERLGLQDGTDYDTMTFGNNSVTFTDYRFNNLDDGQDSQTTTLRSSVYGNRVQFVSQEFDIDYVLNAIYMDPNDPQYAIAKQILDDLFDNASQWLSEEEIEKLTELKNQYGDSSAQYNDYLKECILNNLDALNEWNPNHKHVEKTGYEYGGTPDEFGSGEGTVPEVNKTNWLTSAGLLTQYSRGDVRHFESTNNSEGNRRKEAQEAMDADLSALAGALQSQVGSEYTDYINKAVAATVAHEELIKTWSSHHGFLNMHKKTMAEYSIKDVADTFYAEFEKICKANGKSDTEIQQDEQKREQQKGAYKTLYNMNMSSTASEAGVKSSYQVVNAQSADDIIEEAENKILKPLKAQIMKKLAGQGIPESDLNEILEYAMSQAIINPSSWASQSNDYVYTINTSKVIEKFQDAVRSAVKKKGYNF